MYFKYISFYISILYKSIYLSIFQISSIRLFIIYLSIYPSIYLSKLYKMSGCFSSEGAAGSLGLKVCRFNQPLYLIALSIYLYIYIYPSFYLTIYLSIHPFVVIHVSVSIYLSYPPSSFQTLD